MPSVELERKALMMFELALDMDEDARAQWLTSVVGGNTELKARVEQMLMADSADADLQTAGAFTFADSYVENIEIDGYKIIERIGTGGMGDVYEAERIDGNFTQRVAIKIVRAHFSSDKLLEQFAIERQILANLQHKNILTLLDGGLTRQGLPFVTTELVDGLQLDKYIRENPLVLSKKLELFDQICAAVEHAHAALVVHRDLKPSNVLVEKDGTVKLLDFGIAKVLSNDHNQQTLVSALTPAYASPEQMSGAQASTSTDIYSLGALLYYLLTGSTVHDTIGLSAVETERQATTISIEKPSERVLVKKLRRRIPQDLDAITLKALALDPKRRYLSVTAFRADIANVLARKPVSARFDSRWYRARMFVSRHRLGFLASVVCVTALVVALVISTTQIRAAKAQLARTQAISDFMGDLLMSPASRWDVDISAGPDARMSDVLELAGDHIVTSLSEYPDVQVTLLSRVSVALERLSKNKLSVSLSKQAKDIAESIDDQEVKLHSLLSYGKTLTRSGRSEEGLDALLEAQEIFQKRGDDRSTAYIFLLNDIGNAYGTFERYEEQRDTITEALTLFLATVGDRGHPMLAGAYNHLAGVEMQLGQPEKARLSTDKALKIVEAPRNKDEVVRAYVHMYAAALEIIDRRFDEAEFHAAIAVQELRRNLGGESKELAVAMARHALASAFNQDLSSAQSWMLKSRKIAELAQYHRSRDAKAAEIVIASYSGDYERVLRDFKPSDFRGTSYLITQVGLFELGIAHVKAGDQQLGEAILREAYGLVGERYATSFRQFLDERLEAVDLALP